MKRLRTYYVTERPSGGLSVSATKPAHFGLRVRAARRKDARRLIELISPRIAPSSDIVVA